MNLEEGIQDVDVVIMLRLQRERMSGALLLPSEHEYYKLYGLTEERLEAAKADAIVMHPGPINRGVEMDSQVADGPRSVILQQVSYGIAVRMAVMAMAMQTQGGSTMSHPTTISILNGHLIDPANQIDAANGPAYQLTVRSWPLGAHQQISLRNRPSMPVALYRLPWIGRSQRPPA